MRWWNDNMKYDYVVTLSFGMMTIIVYERQTPNGNVQTLKTLLLSSYFVLILKLLCLHNIVLKDRRSQNNIYSSPLGLK